MQPIPTAILSYGLSGQAFHAPFLHAHEGFHLSRIWERNKNEASSKYPQLLPTSTYEEILSDPSIELVVVNTPNQTHVDYASRALEAGKHVIVEKPFTPTVDEGEALVRLAEEQGKLLSVFQNRRWDSDFLTVKQIMEEGWLGDIVEAEFHFDRYREELSQKAHKEIPGPGAGLIYDLGSHIIDQALFLFGMPEAVFSDIRILRPSSLVNDYFEMLLYYPHLRVRLHSSYLVREPIPSYVLHGSKGSFHKTRADVQEQELVAGKIPGSPLWGAEPPGEEGLLHGEKEGQVIRAVFPAKQGNYMAYYDGIYDAIREGKQLPVTAREGVNVIRLIDAAIRSSKEERVIRL